VVDGGEEEERERERMVGEVGWGGVGKVEVGRVCARIISFFITAPPPPATFITPVINFL
jgi:hypothetical protein